MCKYKKLINTSPHFAGNFEMTYWYVELTRDAGTSVGQAGQKKS